MVNGMGDSSFVHGIGGKCCVSDKKRNLGHRAGLRHVEILGFWDWSSIWLARYAPRVKSGLYAWTALGNEEGSMSQPPVHNDSCSLVQW